MKDKVTSKFINMLLPSMTIACLILSLLLIIFSINIEITRNNSFLNLTTATSVLLFFILVNLLFATYKNNKNRDELILSLNKKNGYLEHAAKILRHDMHSGINTYIPRGIKSLERRLNDDLIRDLKIDPPLKMIKDGLSHTQKVYEGVYEFTNLVKKDSVLEKKYYSIKDILENYLKTTSYKSSVVLDNNLPTINVNKALFCTAIDNLIRNGLKYNDSSDKIVKIYREDNCICVEDNGRGMTQKEFEYLSLPYKRKKDQEEEGSGLGLNISVAIFNEHRFKVTSERLDGKVEDFYKEMNKYEEEYKKNPEIYVFDKIKIEKSAKENNYYGKIYAIGSRQNNKIYVIYKNGDKTKNKIKGTKIKIKYK